jgi:hypothetical protein
MDPASQQALLTVLIGGGVIFAISAFTLFRVFRAFGTADAGGASHRRLMIALIVFIFLCCLVLFALSYR